MDLNSLELSKENQKWLTTAKEVLDLEAKALQEASEKLSLDFLKAIDILMACRGKVVLTGLGKSGHVAEKIASTMSSTGTASFYLHPTEALHGDFGMFSGEDVLLAVAYGGETREVVSVVDFAKKLGASVIAITGNLQSTLAKEAHCVLDASVQKEADTLGLAPTSSSTLALALGDALAVVLMGKKGFTRESFAKLHPGGKLGRSLSKIADLMRPVSELVLVEEFAEVDEVLKAMSNPNFGVVPVVSGKSLRGIITDGDIRRAILSLGSKLHAAKAYQMMSKHPKTLPPSASVLEGTHLMEEFKITSLVIIDESAQVVGLLRLHDLMASHIV